MTLPHHRSTHAPASPPRRQWLAATLPLLGAGLAAALLPGGSRAANSTPTPLEVWKDPNCGCCQDWVDHMQANGFAVKVHATGNNAVRARLGLLTQPVDEALAEGGFDQPSQMGLAMKAAMAKVAGKADGKQVSALVKARLAG